MKRYCLACRYWEFDGGWAGTDVTAGDSWSMDCLKGHWALGGYKTKGHQIYKNMLRARTCNDFELAAYARDSEDEHGAPK